MDEIIVCRCEEVSLKEIKEACRNGMITSQEIKMATRLGMGMCQGRICRSFIDDYLKDRKPEGLEQPSSLTIHKPVRPVSLYQAASKEN